MIRIFIERHLKEGKKGELVSLLKGFRTAAMHQSGFVTGESLESTEDPSIITVLSTWRSLEDWEKWEKSEERMKLYKEIEPLLTERTKISTYRIMAAE